MTTKGDWADLRAALPWLQGVRMHVVPSRRLRVLRDVLRDAGFALHAIDGRHAIDAAGFFSAAARGLAWPAHHGANWDATRDALGDLADGPARRVAIVWEHADVLARADLAAFVAAVQVLDETATDLAAANAAPATQLEVFLVTDPSPAG